MEKLGQEPAFPQIIHYGEDRAKEMFGMSKRLYLDGMAMQGILTANSFMDFETPIVCTEPLKFADELLKLEAE